MPTYRHSYPEQSAAKQYAFQQSSGIDSAEQHKHSAEHDDDYSEYDNDSADYNISGQLYTTGTVD